MSDATNSPDAPPADDAAAFQKRLDAAERQVADYKSLLAEFENARKRTLRDAEAQKKYAHEPLARDLLGALDNLDRAVDAAKAGGDGGPLVQGVSATANMLLDALRRHGVTRVDVAPGTAFDPNVHEAVMQQPTNDHPPGSVVQVLQSGFLIHDRVLRPATVIVASEPPAGGSAE